MHIRPQRASIVSIALGLAALVGCGPPAATDLEIIDVTADMATLGEQVPLQVQVKNNGRDTATVAAAFAGDPSTGLLHKGTPVEVRGGRTETLTLAVPAERPYLERCEFRTTVFLAKPGEPPNLATDLWDDPVPENHSREVRVPVDRPTPTALEVDEPIREVIESVTAEGLKHHYEATVRIRPEGSRWAARSFAVQTQTARGESLELLDAVLGAGGLLRTAAPLVSPPNDPVRTSVARANVRLDFVDCADAPQTIYAERIAVALAPR